MRDYFPKPASAGINQNQFTFMETVLLIYHTDCHHSYASRDVIGIGTSIENVIEICRAHAAKEHEKIDGEQEFNLITIKQTQGYQGNGEYQYEELATDTLF